MYVILNDIVGKRYTPNAVATPCNASVERRSEDGPNQDYDGHLISVNRWEHLIYQLGGHGELIAYVIKAGRVVAGSGKQPHSK